MFGWIKITSRILVVAMVVSLLPLMAQGASKLSTHENRYQRMGSQLSQLRSRHVVQSREVRAAARLLEVLKRQAKRGGLFGLPARVRLPKARAKAQRLSAKLGRLNQQIHQLRQQQSNLRRRLRHMYRARLSVLRRSLSNKGLTSARRQQLQRQARQLQARHKRLSPNTGSVRPSNLPKLRVKIEPLDGPSELRQKADRIKDAEDNVGRILRKLHRKLKRIKKKAQRHKRENKLEQWVDGDQDMFREGSRNPRVVTGKSTSDRLNRAKGNSETPRSPSLRGVTSSPPKSNSPGSQGAQSPPRAGGSPSPAPPPSAGSKNPSEPANKGGGTGETGGRNGTGGFTNKGSADSAAPGTNSGTTHLRPQAGPNTTLQPGIGRKGFPAKGYTLNPKGTLKQQLEALKRYQAHLKRYKKHLRKHHSAFLKRAKRLRRQRRR